MKVDVTKIENFETMTDAEKLEAVLNFDMEIPQAEPVKDDETAKREAAEREASIMEELNQLRRERTASTYTAKYLEMGYDADTARAMADALPDGLGDDFFTKQKSFLDDTIQRTKAQVLNQQPQPTQGTPLTGKQAEDLEMDKLRMYAGLKPKN